MADEPMTLIERLRNPQWESLSHRFCIPELAVIPTCADLRAAADRIERLETAITRYLADDFSCNGGAIELFEVALQ